MSYSPIGDTIALTKLAYTLYSRVIIVARDAPEQFEELLEDLNVYKKVLYRIGGQLDQASDPSYTENLRDALNRCFHTLYDLRDLTTKYENLAWSDRGVFFKRISWAKDQEPIRRFRETIKRQQQQLQLVLSTERRKDSSDGVQRAFVDDDNKTLVARRESEIDAACTCGLPPIQKTTTTATIDSAKTSYSLREDLSNTSPRTFKPGCNPFHERRLSSTGSTAQDNLEHLSCRDRRNSRNSLIDECRFAPSYGRPQDEHQPLSKGEPSMPDQLPLQERTKEPLVLSQKREKHNVPLEVQDVFRNSLKSVRTPLPLEKWLRLAIWWLVKSRIVSHLQAQSSAKWGSTDALQHQNRWHITVSALQAYTDLLKSSWILEEVVLGGTADEELPFVPVRKMVKDLSASLHNDLLERRNLDRNFESFERDGLLKYDLHLLESFEQTIEAEERIPTAIDDPVSAVRWFQIDQDNAGMQHEKVLFRTFVNAQIGSRDNRSKSPSAPYMLLLWTAADSCDIFVSLCNHRASVNLSRKLVAEDLEKYKAGDDHTLFAIKFPSQEVEIKFLSPEDAAGFFSQPLVFFAALEDVKPRPGELAIFQTTLSTYSDSSPRPSHEVLKAKNMVSSETSSCSLRVYESMPDKCWKTTRRLVVNTPASSSVPECVAHWLPADRIKMVVERTKVTVKWSDCGELIKKELGNLRYHYSYIYKADEPNRKIDLEFSSASDAQNFEKCLLLPTEMPPQVTTKLDILSDFQDVRISRLEDVDEPDQQYHSIALYKKNPKGPHTTEIFYAYRDLDWIFSTKSGTPSIIHFPSLRTSHYVSTMPRLPGMPNASDRIPEFSDVELDSREAHFELGCDHDLKKFMYGLTGWKLTFSRPLAKLHLETGHFPKNQKEQYKGVSVQLWEKASEEGQPRIQLAVRLGEKKKEPWITASLVEARCRSEHSIMSYNVEFPTLLLMRGVEVDIKHMTAATRSDAKAEATNKKQWKTTLTFVNTEHKDEFLRASGLVRMYMP